MELASYHSSGTSDFVVAHGRSLKFVHLCICQFLYMYEAIIYPHVIHVTVTHVHSSPVRV